MNTEFTAIIKQAGEWWIGWVEEIPGVNCKEWTREDLVETLRQFVGAQFIAPSENPWQENRAS